MCGHTQSGRRAACYVSIGHSVSVRVHGQVGPRLRRNALKTRFVINHILLAYADRHNRATDEVCRRTDICSRMCSVACLDFSSFEIPLLPEPRFALK